GDEPSRGDDPGDDGGRRGTEPAAVRDAVGAAHRDADLRGTRGLEGVPQGTHHEVGLVLGDETSALPLDHDARRGGAERAHLDLVVEAQGETERVEARAEVGARGRDTHPDGVGREAHHSSPRICAIVTTSAGTRSGVVSTPSRPLIAHCGSLRPWPVTVTEMRAPAGTSPASARWSRPATLAAEPGSTKMPSRE